MKKLIDVVPNFIQDIKKRSSRAFGIGDITKQELDEVCEHLDAIEQILCQNGKVVDLGENPKEKGSK